MDRVNEDRSAAALHTSFEKANLEEEKNNNKWEAIKQPPIWSLSPSQLLTSFIFSYLTHISQHTVCKMVTVNTWSTRESPSDTPDLWHDSSDGRPEKPLALRITSCFLLGLRAAHFFIPSLPVHSRANGFCVNSVMCTVSCWAADLLYVFLNKLHFCFY